MAPVSRCHGHATHSVRERDEVKTPSRGGKVADVSEPQDVVPRNPAEEADLPGQPDPRHVLTERQRRILRVISEWMERHGYAPTMREIAESVGLTSKSSVAYQLSILESRGYLRRAVGRPRTVEIRQPGWSMVRPEPEFDRGGRPVDLSSKEVAYIPVVGQIAAGPPIVAHEADDGSFLLPRQLVGGGDLFALKVAGESMVNAGIFDGDWVVVRRQSVAESGDIVVAMFDGQEAEATVRTYIRTGDNVWLMPHNPAYTPISGNDREIVGKVVALFRRM